MSAPAWLTWLYQRSGLRASVLQLRLMGFSVLRPFLPNELQTNITWQEYLLASTPEKDATRSLRATRLAELAQLNVQKKDYATAISCWQQVIDLTGAIPEPDRQAAAYTGLAIVHLRQDQWDQALAPLQQSVAINPRHVETQGLLGATYSQLGRPEEALAAVQQAVTLDPKLARAWHLLGLVHERADRMEDAITAYRRAIKQEPLFPSFCHSLGHAYKVTGQWEDAQHWFQYELACLDDEARKAKAHLDLGDVARSQNQLLEALAEFEQALELDPTLTLAHIALAAVCRELGREAEWSAHIQTASISIASAHAYDRACYEAVRGETEVALALLVEVMAKEPEYRRWAWRDPDLASLRSDPRFAEVCGPKPEEPMAG